MSNTSGRIYRLVVAPLSILAVFLIYLLFALPSLHRPLVADDTVVAQAAEQMPDQNTIWHPPLYFDILRGLVQGLGISGEGLRWFGVFCFGLNLILTFLIGRKLAQNWQTGLLGALLFAAHPLAIQGSLVLDIDNTILTVLSTLFVLYFIHTYTDKLSGHDFVLGILFFIMLWAKIGTPLILIAAVFLFITLKAGAKKGTLKTLLIAGIGVGIFTVAWWLYAQAYQLPYLDVFARSLFILTKGTTGVSLPVVQELAIRIVRVSLWLGPYLVLTWWLIIGEAFRTYWRDRSVGNQSFCLLYISLILIGYIFIGGTSFGFAKHQYPALPILCVLAAEFFFRLDLRSNRKIWTVLASGAAGFFLLTRFVSGDLIYSISYTLRQIAILSPEELPEFIGKFTLRTGAYFLPFAAGLLWLRMITKKEKPLKPYGMLLLILVFSANFSLNLIQAKASYFTTYCYGQNLEQTERLRQFLVFLNFKNPEKIIIGPEDVLHNAGIELSEYTYSRLWDNRELFIQAIADERVICVAYGFTWNALSTYKNILFDQAVQRLLRNNYRKGKFGSFQVWLRMSYM